MQFSATQIEINNEMPITQWISRDGDANRSAEYFEGKFTESFQSLENNILFYFSSHKPFLNRPTAKVKFLPKPLCPNSNLALNKIPFHPLN